jgi:hypothetical protein
MMILKLMANKGIMFAIGSIGTIFIGLVLGLWHQTGQVNKLRESVAISSTLLAHEIKQTKELRSIIETQNNKILLISEEAKKKEVEANKRVNQLIKERSKLIMESEKLSSGHSEMNKWLREQF